MSAKFDMIADQINYTPSTAVSAGDVVVVGGIVGVAAEDIAANAVGSLYVRGQFELDLATGKTFSQGDAVYVSSSEATDSGTFFGWAVDDSDATNNIVKVLLVQTIPDGAS